MKRLIYFLLSIILTIPALAQDGDKARKDGISTGFKLNQVEDNFGLGMDISSPTFLYNSVAVRLHAMYFLQDHIDMETGEYTETPYFVGRLGLMGVGGRPSENIRLYGEGGLVIVSPGADLSENGNSFGGYGLFGFEFFMSKRIEEGISYYIELGGTGAGAKADKLPGKPIIHNGFTVGTGVRFYFK